MDFDTDTNYDADDGDSGGDTTFADDGGDDNGDSGYEADDWGTVSEGTDADDGADYADASADGACDDGGVGSYDAWGFGGTDALDADGRGEPDHQYAKPGDPVDLSDRIIDVLGAPAGLAIDGYHRLAAAYDRATGDAAAAARHEDEADAYGDLVRGGLREAYEGKRMEVTPAMHRSFERESEERYQEELRKRAESQQGS